MPCSITWEDKGLYARFNGECSIGDVTTVFDRLAADPRMDVARYALFDYLGVSAHDVTEHDIEHAAALDIGMSFTNPRLLFASVTTDERIRALWQHFISVNVKTERHGLFETEAQARAWVAERARA
jgi:hypothetical protein